MNFPEIGPVHAPVIEISKNTGWVYQKSVCVPENLNFGKISGWVFQDLPIRVNNYSLVSNFRIQVLTEFILWNFPIFKITMSSFVIFTGVIRLPMMLTNLNSFYRTIWWFQTLFGCNFLQLKWLWLTRNW